MESVPSELPDAFVPLVFGANQPEYKPLYASVSPGGTVITTWELNAEEIEQLKSSGRLRLTMLFVDLSKPFTPLKLEVL